MSRTSDPTRGSSEPDRLWSRTNLSEATPEVMSPLCWTVWTRGIEFGTRRAFAELGVVAQDQVCLPEDQNERFTGCFYGRQAMNMDKFRETFGAVPGIDVDTMSLLGFGVDTSDREKVSTKITKLPGIAARTPIAVLRQHRRLARLCEDSLSWWRRTVLPQDSAIDPRALVRDATQRFEDGMREQALARAVLGGPSTQLAQIGNHLGRADLVLTASGGLGGVRESDLMQDLWNVSRGTLDRSEFIASYGYHGPSEGNPIGHSWRENPDLVDSFTRQLLLRSDADSPEERHKRAREATKLAVAELLATAPRRSRPVVRALLLATKHATRRVELGKFCFLLGIDGVRRAARDLGSDLVERGIFDDVDDAFYLTYDEFIAPLRADVRELIAYRRARRDEYSALDLPTVFEGMPIPRTTTNSVQTARVLQGEAASAGYARGRARVVRDPSSAELQPGDILVCHFTDPGWAALFTIADALVIDIGGPSSHGAILARELGLPCVVGTGNGTTCIQDGDLIDVNGSTGVVRLLSNQTGHLPA